MSERRAMILLLVRAFEEADPDGLVLPHLERNKATRRALMVTGLGGPRGREGTAWRLHAGEAIMRRNRFLYDVLRRAHPAMPHVLRVAQLGASTAPVFLAISFLLGLGLNLLDPRPEIHLVYVPVLVPLAWSLGLYLLLPLLVLVRGRQGRGIVAPVAGWLYRRAVRRRLGSARMTDDVASPEARVTHKAVMRFAAAWRRLAAPLLAARARRLLHLAAMALTAGALLGLHLRAVAVGQLAGWDARWIDPPDMQTLLGAILGPAAAVLGLEIPDVALLAAASGDPTMWVQLYAMTGLLLVFAPRALLALLEGLRAWRLAETLSVDLEDAYFRRLFSAWRGALRQVDIVPYGFTPHPMAMAALRTVLFDFFGAQADVRLRDPVPTGAGVTSFPRPEAAELCLVILFHAAEPPRAEIHGKLLGELVARLDPARDRMLVVLDTGVRRERSGGRTPADQNAAAWRDVVREGGLTPLHIDLGRGVEATRVSLADGSGDDLLDAVRAALWPAGAETVD